MGASGVGAGGAGDGEGAAGAAGGAGAVALVLGAEVGVLVAPGAVEEITLVVATCCPAAPHPEINDDSAQSVPIRIAFGTKEF